MAHVVSQVRVRVDGKFFRLGETKFFVRGVTYGPFAPNIAGLPFGSLSQTAQDFALIRSLSANVVRLYHVPGQWFLDMAAERELKVLVDLPWPKDLCVLDSPAQRQAVRDAVRHSVAACAQHPAVFAFNLANELPPDIVRWTGAERVVEFIDELAADAKRIDPGCLCTFGNYPPTEFLRPRGIDFVSFNVYLHQKAAFQNYLARLQMIADAKPLVLAEIGADSLREGEERKTAMLESQVEEAFRAGLAGTVIFSFTDDWFQDGRPVEDWAMGLTDRDRNPKPSFFAVQRQFQSAPFFPLPRRPSISVVVAAYNAARTLRPCLESLSRLRYPDYEVILVDDGSTDTTGEIALSFPEVRYVKHEQNLGLSTARNAGILAAQGEIIAFTDADCRADEDWLYYLASGMVGGPFVGLGGPNLLPPEDSALSAAVMVSPGGPAHVMLTDREAEHIPGCNMAFWKWALLDIGGFDPVFHAAGDDVDVCWRLLQAGHKIGFSPAAVVWHYRRASVGAYLRQQHGYGEAEAMLIRKHPDYFNALGGSIWRGRIYGSSNQGVNLRNSIIYRGLFGSAGYQILYTPDPSPYLMLCTSLEYHLLVALPLWVLSPLVHALLPLAVVSLLLPVGLCTIAGAQAVIPSAKRRWWSRLLISLLHFLQPIIRGWARLRTKIGWQSPNLDAHQTLESVALRKSRKPLHCVSYWSERYVDRLALITEILRRLNADHWPNRPDTGWGTHDFEAYGTRWLNLEVVTVSESHRRGDQTIRFRLQPRWSLQARLAFWTLLGSALLTTGFLGVAHVWPCFLLALPAGLAFAFRRQQRAVQAAMQVFLDRLAEERGLAKIEDQAPNTGGPAKAGDSSRAPSRRA